MIVEMIIATMVISDTGSVSTALATTAVPQEMCEWVRAGADQGARVNADGHTVTFIAKVQCVPPPPGQVGGVPPQVMDMFGAILNAIPQRR